MTSFVIESAKSDRSSCKVCKDKISKGSTRIGAVETHPDGFDTTKWFHVACWKVPKKIAPKLEDFAGHHGLNMDEKQTLLNKLSASTPEATKKAKTERKADKEEDEDEKPKKKAKKEVTVSGEGDDLASKYNAMTNAQLKQVLKNNLQLLGGTKSELVERCVDGETHGALPKCPICAKATVKVNDKTKEYFCPGFFDDSMKVRMSCPFKAPQVERLSWLGLNDTPREEASATTPSQKVDITALKEKFASLGAKEACMALIEEARAQSIALPKNDQAAARVHCGTALMATRSEDSSWDPAAALAKLRTELGSEAKEAKADNPCKVEANAKFVAVFEELGKLSKRESMMKASAYLKGALALSQLDFEVTSGKEISKGKKKVAGIGDAIGSKIDELIETGKVAKLDELREQYA
mmetsp:Transcript_33802/g.46810  ORF Transcript_33802/g.46810 Transcript_33802/m.46810 type:complete len:410 (+) Transcript_33802:112-1341(+)|eukprot:CAMPEP_0196582636 /NCGR_PEP_ID=MMETSP1081-20130531/39886_1 /TAXON_ID=36882 /ORGANISM="Pyramimonas amylifera, Strain CCMP720" /LENGTH=409 /DNA_ID=CAMNT_0041903259 /DNA_START=111 /DNA_END=1340 /DNA_ORIENTATION=-